jgi:hypothetical protein
MVILVGTGVGLMLILNDEHVMMNYLKSNRLYARHQVVSRKVTDCQFEQKLPKTPTYSLPTSNLQPGNS